MTSFDNLEEVSSKYELNPVLEENEELIWKGSPDKKAYLFNRIFDNLVLVIAWMFFDIGLIVIALLTIEGHVMANVGIVIFALCHMYEVWKWIYGIVTVNKKCNNTFFAVTDKRIIINTGLIKLSFKSIYFDEIDNVDLKIEPKDKLLKVGTINITSHENKSSIFNIKDSYEAYDIIQKVVADMKMNMEYPNALRPNVNTGYNSKYTEN